MRAVLTTVQILAGVGLLVGVAWLASDYAKTKADNKALRKGRAAGVEIALALGEEVSEAQVRTEVFQNIREELSYVHDEGDCRSPAIDHAFDLLRRHRDGN